MANRGERQSQPRAPSPAPCDGHVMWQLLGPAPRDSTQVSLAPAPSTCLPVGELTHGRQTPGQSLDRRCCGGPSCWWSPHTGPLSPAAVLTLANPETSIYSFLNKQRCLRGGEGRGPLLPTQSPSKLRRLSTWRASRANLKSKNQKGLVSSPRPLPCAQLLMPSACKYTSFQSPHPTKPAAPARRTGRLPPSCQSASRRHCCRLLTSPPLATSLPLHLPAPRAAEATSLSRETQPLPLSGSGLWPPAAGSPAHTAGPHTPQDVLETPRGTCKPASQRPSVDLEPATARSSLGRAKGG